VGKLIKSRIQLRFRIAAERSTTDPGLDKVEEALEYGNEKDKEVERKLS